VHPRKAGVTLQKVPGERLGPQKLLRGVAEEMVAGASSGSGDSGARTWPASSATW
jgi:hypothetical protein